MERSDESQDAVVREFTPTDIVKLFSATFLPLCQSLQEAGVTTKYEIAQALRSNVKPHETEAWATLVLALAIVLDRRDDTAAPAEKSAPAATIFSIIDGGRV